MNKNRYNTKKRGTQQGFTLVELMIVVAVIAIITMVAVSSYQSQTERSRRAAAVGFMLQVANKQEQYLLDNRDYADSIGALPITIPPEVSDFYTVTVEDNDTTAGKPPGYNIFADPKDPQDSIDTSCGKLTLRHTGEKETELGGSRCWK